MKLSISTNQQMTFVQPQQRAQPGVVLMQTEGGVVPQGYPATSQQPVYVLQQVINELMNNYVLIQSKYINVWTCKVPGSLL